MKASSRTLLALALASLGIGAASAQQTLTFTNTDTDAATPGNQPQSVSLLAGSSVSIAPDGNVSAQCALTGTLCAGTGSGGGAAPTVSLAASGFSAQPTGGLYPAGTSFTITPTVANAEVCVRSVTAGTPGNTGWPATISAPPFGAQVVQMLAGDSTYGFSIRCYGAGGATTFTLPSLATAPGTGGCTSTGAGLPAGWVRSSLQLPNQVIRTEGGGTWQNFPISGGFGYLITSANQYHAVQLDTPATAWSGLNFAFDWVEAQQFGAAALGRVYVTVSSCPGDFRLPERGSTAPVDDPTFARGCRNYRDAFGFPNQVVANIRYEVSTEPSNESTCRIAPGRTYYLNFIRADVTDGSIGTPSTEASCNLLPPGSDCGIQLRYD
jgi:hypothetical protein